MSDKVCWICHVNPQQADSPYCPACQAEIEADDILSRNISASWGKLGEKLEGSYYDVNDDDESGERLDPGEAHEAAAYYVTVQHEGEDE